MKSFFSVFLPSAIIIYISWLSLTLTTVKATILIGILVSFAAALISMHFIRYENVKGIFSPANWINFAIYLGIMIYAEIISHIDVAKRIITGKINPAIIKVPHSFKNSDIKTAMLANSITITPGTITIKCADSLFVHWIGYEKDGDISSAFENQIKRFS